MNSFKPYLARTYLRLHTCGENHACTKTVQHNNYLEGNTYLSPNTTKGFRHCFKVNWEHLLVKGIHQTDQDGVMFIDSHSSDSQDPMAKQRLGNIICYKCGQKDVCKKTV